MLSFIIIGYVWHILGRGPFWPPPIHEQPRKSPSWIGLNVSWVYVHQSLFFFVILSTFFCLFFFVVVFFVFYCCCFAPFSSKILDNNFKKLCNACGWSYVSFYEMWHMSVWSWKSKILVLRNLWMVAYLGLTRSLS